MSKVTDVEVSAFSGCFLLYLYIRIFSGPEPQSDGGKREVIDYVQITCYVTNYVTSWFAIYVQTYVYEQHPPNPPLGGPFSPQINLAVVCSCCRGLEQQFTVSFGATHLFRACSCGRSYVTFPWTWPSWVPSHKNLSS